MAMHLIHTIGSIIAAFAEEYLKYPSIGLGVSIQSPFSFKGMPSCMSFLHTR